MPARFFSGKGATMSCLLQDAAGRSLRQWRAMAVWLLAVPGAAAQVGEGDLARSFAKRCTASDGYKSADCRCLAKGIEDSYVGRDRAIAYLYANLFVMAEDELVFLRNYVLSKQCGRITLNEAMMELRGHHKLPIYLFIELNRLGLATSEYFAWGKRNNISELLAACHDRAQSHILVEQQLEACLATSTGLEGCSRCHDGKGVDLAE